MVPLRYVALPAASTCPRVASRAVLQRDAGVGSAEPPFEPEMSWDGRECRVPRLRSISIAAITQNGAGAGARTDGHAVLGGTSGVGLLTARWLVCCGRAAALTLYSRSAKLARDVAASAEWGRIRSSRALVSAVSCDAAQMADARRYGAWARHGLPRLRGVWHAAGVLADGVLGKQSALGLSLYVATTNPHAAPLIRAQHTLLGDVHKERARRFARANQNHPYKPKFCAPVFKMSPMAL